MLSKLRVVMILLVVVLVGAGPVAALDGARDEGAPAVLAWVVQPLEVIRERILDRLPIPDTDNGDTMQVRQLDGEEGGTVSPPPWDEMYGVIEPEG